ncbi:hypothetical protein [Pantoea ananatis]|uniref:hypothetical protein n=1 Tax=Pantoea ananas TaxID=553 RepID=UPI001B3063E3|nr:hypothetical protein [Pantoea ananatis]
MTTNSPNPVDGDVQALTESQRENVIRACRDTIKHAADFNELDVLMARVALAALTAEPVAHRYAYLPGIGDTDWKYVDSYEYANKSSGYSGQDLYATPPAQILRPVELPDEAPNALIALCQQVYDSRIRGASVAHDVWQDCVDELFQQASEVKS